MEEKYSFKGKFNFHTDDKGRVKIPAKLKSYININSFIIIPSYKGNIIIFPLDSFKTFEEKIKTTLSEKEKKVVIDYIYANAIDANMDTQGRIKIPQEFIEKANIQEEVIIVGAMDRIELWSPKEFAKYQRDILEKHRETLESIGL